MFYSIFCHLFIYLIFLYYSNNSLKLYEKLLCNNARLQKVLYKILFNGTEKNMRKNFQNNIFIYIWYLCNMKMIKSFNLETSNTNQPYKILYIFS